MKSIFILLIVSCSYSSDEGQSYADFRLELGAERTSEYLPYLKGKKVGVVGNQSSLIGTTHLVDSLLSLDVDVIKVFSPEHGFRGKADAGEHVNSEKDKKTGLPIVSLYGKNKKPTQAQLSGINVMIFDIQDVGVRFYTYISTLHYVMEACAEAGIPLIVLDRPNPNGHYVDGPVLDKKFKSFIGMHPVPVVHGMTVGEYAQMINGESWLSNELKCELTVIACANYFHSTEYSLPVPPSPNLRSDLSILLYPSLCFLEASTVSVGRGTDGPFERFGHPDFPKDKTSFEFTPKPGLGSKNPKHNGKVCYGFNLRDSVLTERSTELNLSFVIDSYKLLKEEGKAFLLRPKSFNLLAGNDVLINQLKQGMSEEAIRATWQEGLNEYKKIREKYLIYDL